MAEDIHTVLYSFLHIQKVSVYEVNNEVFDVVARTIDNSAGLGGKLLRKVWIHHAAAVLNCHRYIPMEQVT